MVLRPVYCYFHYIVIVGFLGFLLFYYVAAVMFTSFDVIVSLIFYECADHVAEDVFCVHILVGDS